MIATHDARVAQVTGWRIGQSFVGEHAMGGGGHAHDELPWLAVLATATGLLRAQGLTALLGWWWAADMGLASVGGHWPFALWGVPVAALGAAPAAVSVPAISAYRSDVASLLSSSRSIT